MEVMTVLLQEMDMDMEDMVVEMDTGMEVMEDMEMEIKGDIMDMVGMVDTIDHLLVVVIIGRVMVRDMVAHHRVGMAVLLPGVMAAAGVAAEEVEEVVEMKRYLCWLEI